MITLKIEKAKERLVASARRRYKKHVAKKSIKNIGNCSYINLPRGEVAAVLIARNMNHYLSEFYKYYRKLGVNYFVYLDNGSVDGSVSTVMQWENAVILQSDLSFKDFQLELRQIIVTDYCSDGWRLAVDPDEHIDYVGSDRFDLKDLAKELENSGFTAMVAQMLDLVPRASLHELSQMSFEESLRITDGYSLDKIINYDYYDEDMPFHGLVQDNKLSLNSIGWKFGGIRKAYFGEDCCLTKHPLFYFQKDVRPFVHPHLTTGLKLADFTAVLRHYKFSGDYISREERLIKEDRIFHGETRKRMDVIRGNEKFCFNKFELCTDYSAVNLLRRGFIVLSDRARNIYL